jgi:O-glycosyl hydrolase
VSAYKPPTTNTIAIVATNYDSSSHSITFTLSNAPTFSTLTPVITSSTQNMATLTGVSLTSNSFTYTLPAQSIITFSGTGSGGGGGGTGPPTNLNGTLKVAGSATIR